LFDFERRSNIIMSTGRYLSQILIIKLTTVNEKSPSRQGREGLFLSKRINRYYFLTNFLTEKPSSVVTWIK
jgi:hypothetical protein